MPVFIGSRILKMQNILSSEKTVCSQNLFEKTFPKQRQGRAERPIHRCRRHRWRQRRARSEGPASAQENVFEKTILRINLFSELKIFAFLQMRETMNCHFCLFEFEGTQLTVHYKKSKENYG
jgi:hypothetical protein